MVMFEFSPLTPQEPSSSLQATLARLGQEVSSQSLVSKFVVDEQVLKLITPSTGTTIW